MPAHLTQCIQKEREDTQLQVAVMSIINADQQPIQVHVAYMRNCPQKEA